MRALVHSWSGQGVSISAAKEFSADAAVAAVFIRSERLFHIKRRTKSGSEGFSRETSCSGFAPDGLWREFREATSPLAPRGSLKL